MKKREINFMAMCQLLSRWLDGHADLLNQFPFYESLLAEFKQNLQDMELLDQQQGMSTRGLRELKAQMKQALAQKTMDMSHRLEAFAKITQDVVLVPKVHLAPTHLLKYSDSDFLTACHIVYDEALKYADLLTEYKVDAALLESMKTEIAAYELMESSPITAIGMRKMVTNQLGAKVKEQRVVLGKLDSMMEMFRFSDESVYRSYRNHRKVYYRSRSLLVTCQVNAAVTGKGLPNVRVAFYLNDELVVEKKTAQGGGAKIKSMSEGVYSIRLTKMGYVPQTLSVVVQKKELNVVEVELEKKESF